MSGYRLVMLVQCKHVRTYYKAAVTVQLALKGAAPTIRGCLVGDFGFRFASAVGFGVSVFDSHRILNILIGSVSVSEFRFSDIFRARLQLVSS